MSVLEIPTPDPRTLDASVRPFAEAVGERYAIKRTIGRGGMGVVYLARDRRLDRHVAIKTLLPQLASDPGLRDRFVREARAAGAMSHPNIVPVHEANEVGGHVYFVMAYVAGESLAARVRTRGPLGARAVASHMRDVAAALAHAHERGIVHRDVKAENILLDAESRRALVTDFGIARLAEAAPLTATGQLLGTVYYVSPEQVAGDAVDARSDLYSLGVVGFLALTGRFPFEGDLASAVLVAHVTKPAPPVAAIAPSVPAPLAAIVDRCLAKNPEARFASAGALLAALDDAVRQLEDAANAPTGEPRKPAGPHLSDTEAQAVWRRAAELQAATGMQPRPMAVPRPRDAAMDAARRDGLVAEQVRAVAQEAGIDARYVDHALAEHGLSATGRVLRPTVPPRRGRALGAWLAGAPLRIGTARVVSGELAPRDFDRVLNVLRDGTATLGTVAAGGHELRWEGAWLGHHLTAAIVPEDGRTTVRLSQSIRAAAVGRAAAALVATGALAGPGVAVLVNTLLNMPAPSWGVQLPGATIATIAVSAGTLTALGVVPLARGLVRRLWRYNAARLHTLTELLASRIREDAKGAN